MFTATLSPGMRFSAAAAGFLEARTSPVALATIQYVSKNTHDDYARRLKRLSTVFGELKLEEIHLGHIATYQRMRSRGEGFTRLLGPKGNKVAVPSPAGANKINAELDILIRILREAGCWTEAARRAYIPFRPVESERERALSPSEQEQYLAVAASRPEWHPLWWYSLVAAHLTFSTDEMRTIRIGDINLNPSCRMIAVNRRYGKNRYRRRTVPIVDAACAWALERLIERARELAGAEPHHFLFPFRVARGVYDPERPMSPTGMRKQHEAVRAAAGVPWFPLNGWRHTAITRLAEAGVPIAIIMKRSGHVTREMSEHYTHISEQAELAALQGARMRKPPVSITSHPMGRAAFAR